jgi:hypothetical protein
MRCIVPAFAAFGVPAPGAAFLYFNLVSPPARPVVQANFQMLHEEQPGGVVLTLQLENLPDSLAGKPSASKFRERLQGRALNTQVFHLFPLFSPSFPADSSFSARRVQYSFCCWRILSRFRR